MENTTSKAGPSLECTVKTRGYCCGGRCALNGVCPHQKAMLESASESAGEEPDHGG